MELVFILVDPGTPGNLGSVARAMNTMGYADLRLVNPSPFHDSKEARMFAHGSWHILERARICDSFHQAVEDLDLVIGTTAKKRSAAQDYYDCEELPELIRKKGMLVQSAGIVFGKEESGLPNELLRRCDVVSSIPMHAAYPSLNLSQAVMVYSYTFFKAFRPSGTGGDQKAGSAESLNRIRQQVIGLLRLTELDRNPTLSNRILERIMAMGEDDLHLLFSAVHKINERLQQPGR